MKTYYIQFSQKYHAWLVMSQVKGGATADIECGPFISKGIAERKLKELQ